MRADPDMPQMNACMTMWREMVSMRTAVAGTPAYVERARFPAPPVSMADGWPDLLRMCAAEDEYRVHAVKADVLAFQERAREARDAMQILLSSERSDAAPLTGSRNA